MMPLVSILIPAYNSQHYIKHSIHSALAQSYPNIEVIVHDDASTDATLKIAKSIKDKRLRIISTKKNHKMVPGWNYIMSKANGRYIKFLASDDLLHPDCVREMVKILESNSDVSLITCKRNFINSQGKVIRSLGTSTKSGKLNGKKHVRWILTDMSENKIGEPSSVMYRRSDISRVGEFDEKLYNLVDLEYWMRFLIIGDLYYLNEALCSFRVHEQSSTSASVREGLFIHDIFRIIDKYYSSPEYEKILDLDKEMMDDVFKKKTLDITKNIKDLFVRGKISQARQYFSVLTKYRDLGFMTKETIKFLLS